MVKKIARIVERIEDGTDRRDVYCTTYQMRNPFVQFGDGVATELDAHCYFSHAFAADLLPKGGRVLDVCCGRGLLLPFLRYRGNVPVEYVGVDIDPGNATWTDDVDPRGRGRVCQDWGFPVRFVEADAAEMSGAVEDLVGHVEFDLVVYTSSIEHMQPEAQRRSLVECRSLVVEWGMMYLTCPVTEAGRDGYDCQYPAHVYEPSVSELTDWLADAGWRIDGAVGLSTKTRAFRRRLAGESLEAAERVYRTMPREQALPTIANLWPDAATELAFVCSPVV